MGGRKNPPFHCGGSGGKWVWSLVGELRCHMVQLKKKKKQSKRQIGVAGSKSTSDGSVGGLRSSESPSLTHWSQETTACPSLSTTTLPKHLETQVRWGQGLERRLQSGSGGQINSEPNMLHKNQIFGLRLAHLSLESSYWGLMVSRP